MQDAGIEAGFDRSRQLVQAPAPGAAARRDYGPPSAPLKGEGNDPAQVLSQFLHIALKRKWLILSVLLAVVVLGVLKSVLATPRYTATVRIQIDREPLKVLDRGLTAPQEEGGADFLKTQFELLKSRAMAERVVSSLKLQGDSDFLASERVSAIGSIAQVFSQSQRSNTAFPH